MYFMNSYEVEEAQERWRAHPILGPATTTLANLRDASNMVSDGWAYWPKPANAARKLMELIMGDGTSKYRFGEREEVTSDQLRAAYAPIKAFRTRCLKEGIKIDFEIIEAESKGFPKTDDELMVRLNLAKRKAAKIRQKREEPSALEL